MVLEKVKYNSSEHVWIGCDILCKRSSLNATASRAGRNRTSDISTSMLDILAIASHAPLITVEDGRGRQVCVFTPVPVGLAALEVALHLQCRFVSPVSCQFLIALKVKLLFCLPDVVPVPVHKVGSRMYGRSHVHVNDHEVIVT